MFAVPTFDGAFDAETTAVLQSAYRRACERLDIAPETTEPCEHDGTRQTLSDAIMEMAQRGERDPRTLKLHALAVVAMIRQANE
jgi:hypothetical protein